MVTMVTAGLTSQRKAELNQRTKILMSISLWFKRPVFSCEMPILKDLCLTKDSFNFKTNYRRWRIPNITDLCRKQQHQQGCHTLTFKICHSLFIRTKKGVQIHSDHMTELESNLYPSQITIKLSLMLLPWHQYVKDSQMSTSLNTISHI